MKKIQLLTVLSAVLFILSACLSACSGKKDLKPLTGKEARDTLASSKTVYLTGVRRHIHASSDVEADGAIVGHIKEKGFFNNRYVYSIGGEKQFYVKHIWNDGVPPFDKNEYETGETRGYFDMDKNCIGYMQEVFRPERKGGDFFFFDARGKAKPYYIPQSSWTKYGAVIYDMDGNEAGYIDVRRKRGWSQRYFIRISLDDDAASALSEMDRVAMYDKTSTLIVITRSFGSFSSIEPIGKDW